MKQALSLLVLATLLLFLTACDGEMNTRPSEADTGNDPALSGSEPTPVTEPELTSFEKLFRYGPLPAAGENGLWGFIDSTGAYVISPAYLSAAPPHPWGRGSFYPFPGIHIRPSATHTPPPWLKQS